MREALSDVLNISFYKANNIFDGHLTQLSADMLHAHDAKAIHWAYINKKIYKAPYIFTKRVDLPVKDKFSNKLSYYGASAGVGVSDAVVRKIEDFGVSRIYKIPDAGSDIVENKKEQLEFRQRFENKFIVGHIGALVDRDKGQKVILKAVELLNKQNNDFVFVFFGEGEDEKVLKKISKGFENVFWMGFDSNVDSYISAFDAFVFPSRSEGMGSILIDVMQAGVPIVASRVGGIPDIIADKDNGLLIESGDYEKLASNLLDIKNNLMLRERLIKNGISESEKYSALSIAQKYFDIYERVLSE
ncbi:Glycosyltransferase involved in cell wall bisynthesis [Vreelandella arcis]|uniref:Glycosyltransferase involved in cell wall bisynthesis n=2 Tax=Vreelandella arcis TaxID=416873 RepID=A0A1H0IPR5_9GAMM|nr:Glycosyltransferase involved in cell wall bisynthesis [Halomonas arcis]